MGFRLSSLPKPTFLIPVDHISVSTIGLTKATADYRKTMAEDRDRCHCAHYIIHSERPNNTETSAEKN
jgi:hypothetical protein